MIIRTTKAIYFWPARISKQRSDFAANSALLPVCYPQITGFATSVPELVCLVSAGLADVWEAGLWNVLTALIAIGIAGIFLGGATSNVVEQLGVQPAIAGWFLGVVTSIPEMVTFFAIYAASFREGSIVN